MLLAGDIGGTKTDLAVYSDGSGPHAPLLQAEVHSADYPSLQALVEGLKTLKTPVDRACFDVAGPVINGHVRVTNLPWAVDVSSLTKDLKLKSVRLINDLEAVARAIPILRPSDVRTLNARSARQEWFDRRRSAWYRARRIISDVGWIEVCLSQLRRRAFGFLTDG